MGGEGRAEVEGNESVALFTLRSGGEGAVRHALKGWSE